MSRSVQGLLCALILAASATLARANAPVPIPALQDRSREMIRKVFSREFAKTTPAEKQALAKLLIAQAGETKDDDAARYVALTDAMDVAAGAGDGTTAMLAIDALAAQYAVDALDLRRQALAKANATSNNADESETVMRLALQTADQAALVDAFEAVQQLANIAEAAANKTHKVTIVVSLQVKLENLRGLVGEFAQVREAFARLDRNPNDAGAHLAIGQFYGLHKGQWALGLPQLAAGGDAELRDLAARELATPADGFAQAALGDAWWDYADKSSGLTKIVVAAHARELYAQAQQAIQGITLARIQSRLATAAVTQPQPNPPAVPAVPAPVRDRGVDLLALIDAGKDSAQGKWTRTTEGMLCEGGSYACLQLPYALPQEYDLKTTFVRQQGEGSLALLLVAGKRAFGFALDVKGEARFESIDKKAAKDNPTVVPVALSTGHRYTLAVEVRKDRLRAVLDDKPLVEWKTDYKDVSRYAPWKLGDNGLCGIGANNAKVLFQKIELVEVTGKGKATR